jgi:hypothetical protein
VLFLKKKNKMGRSNNIIHVQINSLDALECLIGGDSEFEFDIRNNVVQKFAEKHLKTVANSTVMLEVENKIKSYVYDNTSYRNKLSTSFKDTIQNVIKTEYEQILSKAFLELKRKHINELQIEIKNFEEKYSDTLIKHFEKKHIQKIIDAKVDAKIKRMLKLIATDENGSSKVSSIHDI